MPLYGAVIRGSGFVEDALVVGLVGGDDVVGAEVFLGVDAGGLAHFAAAVGAGSQMEQATRRPRLPNRAWGTLRVSLLPRRMLKCDPLGHPYVDRILFSKSEPPAFGSDEAEGFELRGVRNRSAHTGQKRKTQPQRRGWGTQRPARDPKWNRQRQDPGSQTEPWAPAPIRRLAFPEVRHPTALPFSSVSNLFVRRSSI